MDNDRKNFIHMIGEMLAESEETFIMLSVSSNGEESTFLSNANDKQLKIMLQEITNSISNK